MHCSFFLVITLRLKSALHNHNLEVCDTCAPSNQVRIRPASAKRDYLPLESKNTITTARPPMIACMTKQRPASDI